MPFNNSPTTLTAVPAEPAAKAPDPFARTIARQIEALRTALLPSYLMEDDAISELSLRLFAVCAFELSQAYSAHRAGGAS